MIDNKTRIVNIYPAGGTAIVQDLEFFRVKAELGALRQVCAEAYQMAGAIGAPSEALDNLSAAANGDPIPHETFLPIFCDHLAAHDAEVAAKAVDTLISDHSKIYGASENPFNVIEVDDAKQYAAQLRTKVKQ